MTPTGTEPQMLTGIKPRLCIHFKEGRLCVRGKNCMFAHGHEEIGQTYSVPIGPTPLLKTKMCSHFLGGECLRGEGCSFAHSEQEIGQPQPEEDKRVHLKSKLCTFFQAG